MADWYKIPPSMRMTEGEYLANIRGLNVLFGAVLGFVLADSRALATDQFTFLLVLSAGIVVTILYLASSPYRLFYALTAAILIATLPWVLGRMGIPPIEKLQPTLAVWAAMVVGIEIMPRTKDKASTC